jgi:hypothetical protein
MVPQVISYHWYLIKLILGTIPLTIGDFRNSQVYVGPGIDAWLLYKTTKRGKHRESDAMTYSQKRNCLGVIFKLTSYLARLKFLTSRLTYINSINEPLSVVRSWSSKPPWRGWPMSTREPSKRRWGARGKRTRRPKPSNWQTVRIHYLKSLRHMYICTSGWPDWANFRLLTTVYFGQFLENYRNNRCFRTTFFPRWKFNDTQGQMY